MDCNTVERAILEHGTDLHDAAREHVSGCPSCQEFARLHRALLEQGAGAGPSPALDRAVLEAAHRRLRRGWRWLPPLRNVYRAAAAALVLAVALGILGRRWAATRPQESVAGATPQSAAAHHWAGAQVDLEVIEGGLDAALAELDTMGASAPGEDASFDSRESWDALMELEFDAYFESECLRQAGG
jgi:hypothetical protein